MMINMGDEDEKRIVRIMLLQPWKEWSVGEILIIKQIVEGRFMLDTNREVKQEERDIKYWLEKTIIKQWKLARKVRNHYVLENNIKTLQCVKEQSA